MGLLTRLNHHTDLITRMASTVNADFTIAMVDRRMSGQELRNAVFACVGCEGGARCPDWLEAHSAGAEDTPAYCRNRDLLQRLRA
ncbi:DUF6455 family protein [Pararhodobacter oceanensis]|uniref:DUF6455 family protein n=1 Tax=Pararhodobacter oceanensis TaxID=2172121 RepID=UPI003A935901